MAKRKKTYRKSSKCPEPLNTLIDIAGAAALGTIVHSQIKRDYARGNGPASARAAAMVYGAGSFRSGSAGIINLGGLMGLNSALRDIERAQIKANCANEPPFRDRVSGVKVHGSPPLRKNLWRDHCEDGSVFGINPEDYSSPDDYYEALDNAKNRIDVSQTNVTTDSNGKCATQESSVQQSTKNIWRKYCSDGTPYGLNPEDYSSADDYEDAIAEARRKSSNYEA